MRNRHLAEGLAAATMLLCGGLLAMGQTAVLAHGPNALPAAEASIANTHLTIDQVVQRLQQRNAERAAALEQYESTRDYGMQYRGFPSNRDAEMVVHMAYRAPDSKEFSVVSQSGLKFINEHVFKKLLEAEREAAANPESRRRSALTAENYEFTMAGHESSPDGGRYILDLVPRLKSKFLYRGKIWVDDKDFAVVRIQGEPAVNPSFWIKKTSIEHTYAKMGEFWLPVENRTESLIRLGGVAHLSIEYKDYKILKSETLAGVAGVPTK
jgi:hypothetical protein